MRAAVQTAPSAPRKGPRPQSPLTHAWERKRGNCPARWAAIPVWFLRNIGSSLGQIAQNCILNIIAIHLDEGEGFPDWVQITEEELAEWCDSTPEAVHELLLEVGGSVKKAPARNEIRLLEWRDVTDEDSPVPSRTGTEKRARIRPDKRRKAYRVCFENFLAFGNRVIAEREARANGDAKAKSSDPKPDRESKPQLVLGYSEPLTLKAGEPSQPIPISATEATLRYRCDAPVTIESEVHGAELTVHIYTAKQEEEETPAVSAEYRAFEKICLDTMLPQFLSTPPASLIPGFFRELKRAGVPIEVFHKRLLLRKSGIREWTGLRFIIEDVVKAARLIGRATAEVNGNGTSVPQRGEIPEFDEEAFRQETARDQEAFEEEGRRRTMERVK